MSRESILIVEDEKLIRWTMRDRLEKAGYTPYEADCGAKGLEVLEEEAIDVVLLDYRLPDFDGLEVLRRIKQRHPEVGVILVTAYSSVHSAVEAIKLGANDYLDKPVEFDALLAAIAKTLETTRLRREVRRLRSEAEFSSGPSSIIGQSEGIQKVLVLLKKVARSAAATVLVQGESGTGKDLVAKAIHYASDRADRPFMNITCSAMQETLLESELFGHERGAFTDAKQQKRGLFELAKDGTVFLDEIGDMGLALQAKLLRFLEEKAFKRVGGAVDLSVDVRIVAATNVDLQRAVELGRFREDLYYRLKVVPIFLPPLRDRREDIPLLVTSFIERFAREFKKPTHGVTPEALEVLERYHWPGNVRELRNVVERAMILESKEILEIVDLPEEIVLASEEGVGIAPRGPTSAGVRPASGGPGVTSGSENGPVVVLPDKGVALKDVERDLVRQALERTGGNQTRAAKLLGISRDALRYKVTKFGFA